MSLGNGPGPLHVLKSGFSSPLPKMVGFEGMILYIRHIQCLWESTFRASVIAVLELLYASF